MYFLKGPVTSSTRNVPMTHEQLDVLCLCFIGACPYLYHALFRYSPTRSTVVNSEFILSAWRSLELHVLSFLCWLKFRDDY